MRHLLGGKVLIIKLLRKNTSQHLFLVETFTIKVIWVCMCN